MVKPGDDVKSDVEGALANGLDAVLYNPISKENKIEIAGIVPCYSLNEGVIRLSGFRRKIKKMRQIWNTP